MKMKKEKLSNINQPIEFGYTLEMPRSQIFKVFRYPASLILLIFFAFIALGMPDGLLGVAWPSMRNSYGQPLDAVTSLLFCSTSGYLLSSFFNGSLTRWLGVGRILIISCALTGIALAGYTFVPAWWMVSILGIFTGFGAGAIDASLNTFVADHYGPGLMQWLHASYGVGITAGPFIMTTAIVSFDTWKLGYRIVAAFQFLMALAFITTFAGWKIDSTGESGSRRTIRKFIAPISQSLRNRAVLASMFLFLLYTGTEVTAGTWAFGVLTSRGVSEKVGGFVVGSYWAMFTAGRVFAGFIARKVKPENLVTGGLILAITGAALFSISAGRVWDIIGVGLIGVSIAPIFPALVSGTAARVGDEHTGNTIGLQIASAGLGAVVLPGLSGVIAQRINLDVIPLIIAAAFIMQLILVFGFKKRWLASQSTVIYEYGEEGT